MKKKIVEIKNLHFKYDKNYLFKELNMTVYEGEFAALIGENGVGKSTLLNLILQDIKPQKGEIKLFEDNIKINNHFDNLVYVSQNSYINFKNFPSTIKEVTEVHLRHLKSNKTLEEVLKKLDLTRHKDKALSELSGGQLQRVALLPSIIKDAKLIILDEPETGIDERFSEEFYKILNDLKSEGKTILMVTHHFHEVHDYVDYVYEIKDLQCRKTKVENA